MEESDDSAAGDVHDPTGAPSRTEIASPSHEQSDDESNRPSSRAAVRSAVQTVHSGKRSRSKRHANAGAAEVSLDVGEFSPLNAAVQL